ncbi:unnamed protein product, partial [Oikopleura dioica]
MIARQEWDGSRTVFLPSFRLAAAPLVPAHFPEAPGGELIDLEPVEADVDEPVNYAALEEVVDEDDEEEDSEDEDGFAEFEPARLEVADHQLFILKEKDEIRQTDSETYIWTRENCQGQCGLCSNDVMYMMTGCRCKRPLVCTDCARQMCPNYWCQCPFCCAVCVASLTELHNIVVENEKVIFNQILVLFSVGRFKLQILH